MTQSARPSRLVLLLLGCAMANVGCATAPSSNFKDGDDNSRSNSLETEDPLTHVRDDWVVTEAEAIRWHEVKDENGPALTGNASWHQFVGFVEEKLRGYGVVDIQRNQWSFERWHTSQWPDTSRWSLVSDGKEVEVASYGANSGSTGPEGITAGLVYYDADDPPHDVTNKIVVFKTSVDQPMIDGLANTDYEYRSTYESFPEYGRPLPDDLNSNLSWKIFTQLLQVPAFINIAAEGNAAGALFVFDAGSDQMAGMYTFPVPPIHDLPSLYLDRTVGGKVIADAKMGANATLRLEAAITTSTAYQLIGYLPGSQYGSAGDELIQLTTHTDGPSISQDNGALGILGVIKYMSQIPQAKRPRTLMVFLDCRHFMPGAEQAFAVQDWFSRNPHARKKIVGVIGMEHLGQIEFIEDGNILLESGRVYPSHIWTTNNDKMVELAIKSVIDNKLRSAFVLNVARPGHGGGNQGRWYGLAKSAPAIGVPAFAIMGLMGAYWATSADIERLDANLFRHQVATFIQLTGELMTEDMSELQAPNGG